MRRLRTHRLRYPVKQRTTKKVSGRRLELSPDLIIKANEPLLRVLVVDGEESICFSMKEYFTLQGYNVDIAQELGEAERLVEATAYDIVVQDLRLGPALEPDGLELIKFIRRQNSQTKIIVLTAYGSPEMEKETREYGADAFLRKPKPLSDVAQVIQGLIESHPKQAAHKA